MGDTQKFLNAVSEELLKPENEERKKMLTLFMSMLAASIRFEFGEDANISNFMVRYIDHQRFKDERGGLDAAEQKFIQHYPFPAQAPVKVSSLIALPLIMGNRNVLAVIVKKGLKSDDLGMNRMWSYYVLAALARTNHDIAVYELKDLNVHNALFVSNGELKHNSPEGTLRHSSRDGYFAILYSQCCTCRI